MRLARPTGGGLDAVLKFRSVTPESERGQRFRNEALQMRELSRAGTKGVLPILDVEPGEDPSWYVMPKAEMLQVVVDQAGTLQEIVNWVLTLARTLSRLAEQDIYHRDVKPDNLFWYDDGPVFADFGIAYWGEPGVTVGAQKFGPQWFIAPEMRSKNPTDPGRQADVYSLAQTLIVFVRPADKFPPPGTFRAGTNEYDLNVDWQGDHDAMDTLEHVLEAATRYSVRDRLVMADFAEELELWLASADVDITRNTGFRSGWGPDDDLVRDEKETRRILLRGLGRLEAADKAFKESSEVRYGDSERLRWLGDYDLPVTPDGESAIDGHLTSVAWDRPGGRRILLGAAFFGREVSFMSEIQRLVGNNWQLERSWPDTDWGRTRLPSAKHLFHQLVDGVVAYLCPPT
ncbi:protein kinase domain-containing protein [Actinacidiphila oryziradicis]|uniref:protein kinase domain-containing protein n=1 Tax=Actinacidiphila oryziradicis TaxID=2571141 RepID=UPI0022458D0F|nr:protein kinase [Actinacidiphila oryziradicis]